MNKRSLLTRMDAVQSPVIPLVGKLIAENPGTISLGQGIAFYPPPPQILTAIATSFEDVTNHQYKSVQGIPSLQTAIAAKLAQDNQITIEASQNAVMVTAGANMGFLNAILAITSPGDEIILNTPYYFNHEMAIRMVGCQPICVPTNSCYQLQPEAIAAAITPRTRAIVTISPNNPTGAVYPAQTLQEINQLCQVQGLYHISDEAYEYFTYDGVQHFSPASLPHSAAHTISLFSLSKSYGMAGWRIGYMVIPQSLLLAVQKIQDTNLICPPVVGQYAAIAALEAGSAYCQQFLPEITHSRHRLLTALGKISDLCDWVITEGAFYNFIKVHLPYPDLEIVQRLIREHQVAVLPGSTFGMKEGCYLRIAYGALHQENVTTGTERLIQGLRILSQAKNSH
jgi:aspartate/methionine/tyrosine aminotransferase